MTATHTGGSNTLAGVLTRRRKALGLSEAEVARRAALPLTTTQRRFKNADRLTHAELVAISYALKIRRPSKLIAEAEAEAEKQGAFAEAQVGSAA